MITIAFALGLGIGIIIGVVGLAIIVFKAETDYNERIK